MRTALSALALAAAALFAGGAPAVAAAAGEPAGPVPNQGYSVPVGAITDLGALPMLGGLGYDFAHLLGQ
ncbi:hypothetical protein [Kitasatospora sp. NPDC088134]|uniref:hypothetical protein n=1 Tax=Kitasatospora sp. NPDC088134 TaxID=3364071 RepID=UPI00382FD263